MFSVFFPEVRDLLNKPVYHFLGFVGFSCFSKFRGGLSIPFLPLGSDILKISKSVSPQGCKDGTRNWP